MRYDKLSPSLALALEDFNEEGAPGLIRHARTLGVVGASAAAGLEPPRIPVFLFCHEEADFRDLEEHGIQVNEDQGWVRTAFLPVESVDQLTESPEVERVTASHILRPAMDAASIRCSLPSFRQRTSLTGRGVLIGIVDSGIDPAHRAFQGRILRIWDQTLVGSGVQEGQYGRELSGIQLAKSNDTNGHGTHVAGIAAGADTTLGSIAPESTLAIVKTDFNDAHIADGIRYLARLGQERNMPVVINLSLGGHNDPHDGSDPLSLKIDQISGPGRIVCCAAGNEGNDDIHGQAVVPPDGEVSLRFKVPANAVEGVMLAGWYAGTSFLEVAIQTPGGFFTPFQPVTPPGQRFIQRHTFPDAHVSLATPPRDPGNGDHTFRINVGSPAAGGAVQGGVWRLRVRNPSQVGVKLDVWTLDGLESPEVIFLGTAAQDSLKIGSPGSSASAITVASFTTRSQWTDIDGNPHQVRLDLDDISDFSSEGPLRNGMEKPDLAAPGAMIFSCLSSSASPGRAVIINQEFMAMAGTSMATPFITGIVALLLQNDPTLTPSAAKGLLKAQAKIPGGSAGSFHPKWGSGLIDTLALLNP
jgi:subtilisin family serine protease